MTVIRQDKPVCATVAEWRTASPDVIGACPTSMSVADRLAPSPSARIVLLGAVGLGRAAFASCQLPTIAERGRLRRVAQVEGQLRRDGRPSWLANRRMGGSMMLTGSSG